MLKPPHPAAVGGYLAAMLINPNNHALDGGPATAQMEKEVVGAAGRDVRLRPTHLGHLTTSGTIANLEALFVARELHPAAGSPTARRRTTRTAGCAACSASRAPRCRSTRGPDGPRRPGRAAGRRARSAPWSLTAGTTGLGAVDRCTRSWRCAAARRARARRRGVRRVLHAAGRRGRSGRARPGAVAGHRRLRLGRGRPAQARAAAVRLRRGAVRRSGRRAVLPARLAVHVLHLRRAAPRRDQPGVLARGRERRRRCG